MIGEMWVLGRGEILKDEACKRWRSVISLWERSGECPTYSHQYKVKSGPAGEGGELKVFLF